MPELPEVETVARLIAPGVTGRTVVGIRAPWERSLGGATRAAFVRAVRGARIQRVWRRAKYVVLDLARTGRPAGALLVHLRMSGRLTVEDAGADDGAWLRVALRLSDGNELRFDDVRKFGRFTFVPDVAAALSHIGPEPLDDAFTSEDFARSLRARRAMLKPLLLDQTFVAGLGNIYVDESLHRAGLHPLRRSDRVPRARAVALHGIVRDVLASAIEREGSSFDTFYRTPEGQPGSYQHQFQVYGREGEPCATCGRAVRRIVVGQRGTHFCPRCQPAPRAARQPAAPRMTIRRAVPEDAEQIGPLHVRAWQVAYRGQMPQAVLDALDPAVRIEHHRKWIRSDDAPLRRTWVLQQSGNVLGFAITGPSRHEGDGPDVGEVAAIYLQPDRVGQGLGKRLFSYALTALRRLGFRHVVVWVLDTNDRARRFYEAAGLTHDGTSKAIQIGGADLIEVPYRGPLA